MTSPPRERAAGTDRRASLLAGLLVGAGLMAAVDEIVFHQVLAWHHFYDRSTPDVALLSDGVLHAAELVAVVGGLFWFADLRRRQVAHGPTTRAGLVLGLGAFQLVDGLVNHKVLRLHQVRYDVDLLPYDLAWNLAGAALLAVGAVLLVRARRHRAADGGATTAVR